MAPRYTLCVHQLVIPSRVVSMTSVVFDGDHVQALHADRRGGLLLVTFNEIGSTADGVHFWGDKVAARFGVSALGIMSKRKNWFPRADMLTLADRVRPILDQHIVIVTYGFSMGGYGALKYAASLSATHALAFSPQWSIDPAEVAAVDDRFCRHFRPELHPDMAIGAADLAQNAAIVVNPYERRDLFHAEQITAAWGGGAVVPCFNIGHDTVRAVSSAASFKTFLKAFLSDPGDVLTMSHLLRDYKKKSFSYYYELGQIALNSGKLDLADSLYRRAKGVNPAHKYLANWRHKLDVVRD